MPDPKVQPNQGLPTAPVSIPPTGTAGSMNVNPVAKPALPIDTIPQPTPSTPQIFPTPPVTPSSGLPPKPFGMPAFDQAPKSPGIPAAPPPVKKGFPKIVIFLITGLILLAGVAFAVMKFLPNASSTLTGGTIIWWGLWEDDSAVAPLIAEYESSHPGVKIKYVRQSQQDYRERLTNSLAKGEGPDIFRFHNTWAPMFKGSLDYLPASVMSTSDFSKTFYPVVVSDLTSESGIIGLPLEYDGLTLYINEDIFAKAGRVPPTTWDDLRKTACQLTTFVNNAIDQSGVALGSTTNVDGWQDVLAFMILENGADLAKPSGQLAEDTLNYFASFATGKSCPEFGGIRTWDATLPASTAAFAAGKVAMYFGPSWRAFEIREQNPNLKFRTVALPQLPKADPNERDYAYASYWAEGVWTKSKLKTQAWDFLKFLTTQESLTKLYQNEASSRLFGEPYPRVDMADLLASDPVVGTIISQAPSAQSWYLVSRTWDGPTGLNSQVSKYYEDAVNAVIKGDSAKTALSTVASGMTQVLGHYGIAVH